MLEIKDIIAFEPDRTDINYNGRVFTMNNNTFIELYNLGSYIDVFAKYHMNVLYVQDNSNGNRYSFINLFIFSWNVGGKAIFK